MIGLRFLLLRTYTLIYVFRELHDISMEYFFSVSRDSTQSVSREETVTIYMVHS